MPELPRTVIAAGVVAFLLAAASAWLVLGAMPHVTDEVSYTLQARLLAAGQRTGPPALSPSMAEYPFWNLSPRSFSVFPPGWPGLLSIGERLGAAWLINPLLWAAAPILTWRLAADRLTPQTAVLGAWLLALSPAALLLAGSRMSQPSVLVALLLACLGRPWLTGGAVAYVVLARPFDAALLGAPLLLWSMWRHRHPAPVLLPGLAAGLLLWDNASLTGSSFTFPVTPWFDAWATPGCNRLGFGEAVGCVTPGYGLSDALRQAGDSLLRLDRLLLGVSGGLVFVLGGLVVLGRRGMWLVVPLVVTVCGYAAYWSPGMAYGARFYAPALPGLCLLVAALAVKLGGRRAWLVLLLPIAGLLRIAPTLQDYWCLDGSLSRALDEAGVGEGVSFVRSVGTVSRSWPSVGVEAFACDPMLVAGEGFWRMDPTDEAGLRVRHAPEPLEQIPAYMEALAPGRAAWLAVRGEGDAAWRLFSVGPGGLTPLSPDDQ